MTEPVPGPIGIFDSGYGGLTVFKEIQAALPDKDYLYLGDNARSPYGTRALDTVYDFTLQGVDELFARGCHLVILACNTASANALRSIQQRDLASRGEHKRVLGVIRPTTERLKDLSATGHLGIMATQATVDSKSYIIEAEKYSSETVMHQQACPMLVPLIENHEQEGPAADHFIQKYVEQLLSQHADMDAILLACTHYPILYNRIQSLLSDSVKLISQGSLVAESLVDYLQRHAWMNELCAEDGKTHFLTSGSAERFDEEASRYFGSPVRSERIALGTKKRP